MRPILKPLAAGLFGAGFIIGSAYAEAVKVSPELTVFTKEQASSNEGAPVVLRGSATKRGTVFDGGNRYVDRGPVEIGAGSTLWLADPATGDIIACEPRRTSRVGSRFVDCFGGPSY